MADFRTATEQNPEARLCPGCGHNGAENWLEAPDRFHGRPQLYQLVRCPLCSHVWVDNPPRPEEMGYHYGSDYDRQIAAAGEGASQRWLMRRETLAQYKSAGALLDLGCSSGSFLASLKGEPWSLFGIEISPDCAKRAEAKSGAQVFAGDILAAPFGPETFDVVTCFHVFEHLYPPRQVLEKVWEWLKPGGIFYTLVPNIDSAGVRIFRSYWYGLELPRHLHHFSPTSLRHLANSAGFQEVSLITHRELCLEESLRYLCDDILRRFGFSRAPLATAKAPSLPWKVVRKVLRLTIVPLLSQLTVIAGDGESIHVILRKRARAQECTP